MTQVYEQYVIGMLTNLESLPVQRIHNMLKMFVPASGGDRGYDCSEQARRRFGRTARARRDTLPSVCRGCLPLGAAALPDAHGRGGQARALGGPVPHRRPALSCCKREHRGGRLAVAASPRTFDGPGIGLAIGGAGRVTR